MFALLYIDLDGFKPINDQLGHHAGDCVLVEIARRFIACLRTSDTVARVGGDEFVALLGEIRNRDEVTQVADKLFDALSAPIDAAGTQARVGASMGAAFFPEDAADAEQLIVFADAAMYRAKNRGKGVLVFAGDEVG